ncbi:hypothetical protein CPB86DRAFT_801442 [Serendipita vermifera]|nr:hypothetical protein CPB86DRAFT_801442 [Serendipita vermifera]
MKTDEGTQLMRRFTRYNSRVVRPNDEPPGDLTHITLEFSLNGSIIRKFDLSSRSTVGIWEHCRHFLFGTSKGKQRPLGDDMLKGGSVQSQVISQDKAAKGRRVWSTDERPILGGLVGELEVSAWRKLGDSERKSFMFNSEDSGCAYRSRWIPSVGW